MLGVSILPPERTSADPVDPDGVVNVPVVLLTLNKSNAKWLQIEAAIYAIVSLPVVNEYGLAV